MISVKNLVKRYGYVYAVNDVSFEIEKGEIVGLLGPNGAGKTTTLKVLTTFISPNKGNVSVASYDVVRDPLEVRKRVGYLPENAPLYDDMKVLDYLNFVISARKIPQNNRSARLSYIIEKCKIKSVLKKSISELSKGFRQRVCLGQAIVHDPEILILDEPTSGLDPNQILEIRELIRELGKEKTVIVSTHILQEVQAVCGRIIIIHEGKIVADGTWDKLKDEAQEEEVFTLCIRNDIKDLEEQIRKINTVKSVSCNEEGGDGADKLFRFKIKTPKGLDIREKLYYLVRDNDLTLNELSKVSVNLEDVFYNLTI